MAQDVVRDLLRHSHPVGGRHWRFVSLQNSLQCVSHELLEFALVNMRVIQPGAQRLQQLLVNAPLKRAEWIQMPTGAARHAPPFKRRRASDPHLRQPIGQAHAARLLRLERTKRPCVADSPTIRCCASLLIAWLTGWPGLSMLIGTPLLIEMGTARLDGM